jgi:hypothetical protein
MRRRSGRAIPEDDRPRRRFAESPLKDRLDVIVKAGAAGKPFLVRLAPVSERKRLGRSASDYRRRYGKAGFSFEVRPVPNEDQVGVWVVWTPPTVSEPTCPGSQGAPQAG